MNGYGVLSAKTDFKHAVATILEDEPRAPDPQRIAVTLTAGEKPAQHRGWLTVALDDPRTPQLRVPIHLAVREVVRLTPRSLFLNTLTRDEPYVATVAVDLPAGWSAPVTEAVASADWIQLVDPPAELAKGSQIQIRLDTERMPQTFNGSVTFTTSHPNVPPMVIPIYGFLK